MSSSKKTEFLKLNKWELFDYPEMNDFNKDNQIIDSFFKKTAIELNNIKNEVFFNDYVEELKDKLNETHDKTWGKGPIINRLGDFADVFFDIAPDLNVGVDGFTHNKNHIILNGKSYDRGVSSFTNKFSKKINDRLFTIYSGLFDYCHDSLFSDVPLRTPTGSFMVFKHEYEYRLFTTPFGVIATAESPSNGSFQVSREGSIEIHELDYNSPFMLSLIAVDPRYHGKLKRVDLFDYYEYCYEKRGDYEKGEEFDDRLEWLKEVKSGGDK